MTNNYLDSSRRRVLTTVLVSIFILGLITGTLLMKATRNDSVGLPAAISAVPSVPNSSPTDATLCGAETNIIQVAKTVGPSVVTVINLQSPATGAPPVKKGLGSGIIVSQDGLILTNSHVVEAADRVDVILIGSDAVTAKVLGSDPRIDVAILKVPGHSLPAAVLGNSDQLQVGQEAIAIGNPLGFERTVTVGVVSALNRAIPGGGTSLRDLIQTDASINPGNSGGPLLDSCGRVIAINTAVVGSDDGFGGGLGFAVPINTAKHALADVQKSGHIVVPWMGIAYTVITPELVGAFSLPVKQGLIVGSVAPGSPAEKAGLKKGDIITAMNGKALVDADRIQEFIRNAQVGDKVSLTYQRESAKHTVTITMEEMPKNLSVNTG